MLAGDDTDPDSRDDPSSACRPVRPPLRPSRPDGGRKHGFACGPRLVGGRYKPLTDAEVMRIHELALKLLEDLGLSQLTPSLEARAVMAGCRVDGDGRVRFPRALVEDVIARARRTFVLHGIDPRHDLEIGGKRVHSGTGGAAPTIMDFETGRYRESTVADLYDIARLVDRLDNIHWYHPLDRGARREDHLSIWT